MAESICKRCATTHSPSNAVGCHVKDGRVYGHYASNHFDLTCLKWLGSPGALPDMSAICDVCVMAMVNSGKLVEEREYVDFNEMAEDTKAINTQADKRIKA